MNLKPRWEDPLSAQPWDPELTLRVRRARSLGQPSVPARPAPPPKRVSRRALLVGTLGFMVGTAQLATERTAQAEGKPKVILDHLDFPEHLGARKYKRDLERQLKREARLADWGASSDSIIEYRFAITRLSVDEKDSVLTVSCSAIGRLPRGRTAVSKLSFSGRPSERDELVKKVLAIVARGVIERLAQLERVRRG